MRPKGSQVPARHLRPHGTPHGPVVVRSTTVVPLRGHFPMTALNIANCSISEKTISSSAVDLEHNRSVTLREEDLPIAGHALELANLSGLEGNTRAGHQVPHRARYENLTSLPACADPRRKVYRDAGDIVVVEVALPRVHAHSNFDTQ